MLNEEESKYFEKWSDLQTNGQFHKRIILGLIGLIGILGLIILFAGNSTPLVVERDVSIYRALSVERTELRPTKEAVADLASEFVKIRYEWNSFEPKTITKKLEPLTTEDFRTRLLEEIGKKSFQNKQGESVEQSLARVRPDVSEKAIIVSFDRVLRINNIPVVVPTQVSLLLAEGPKTYFNPLGLYVNGLIEHEDR